MKRLTIVSLIAIAAIAVPLGAQPRANDAHHQAQSSKEKKPAAGKAKSKKPVVRPSRTSQAQQPPRIAIQEPET